MTGISDQFRHILALVSILAFGLSCPSAFGRSQPQDQAQGTEAQTAWVPAYCATSHRVGRMELAVTNQGVLGADRVYSSDCFTGRRLQSCEYPIGSDNSYLYRVALWVGGVVDGDTLVSTGFTNTAYAIEFHPQSAPDGFIVPRSINHPDPQVAELALSEEDYVATYDDSCTECFGTGFNAADNRAHRPIGVRVTQTSLAWSSPELEDIVLITYRLENIGPSSIQQCHLGVYVDADVYGPTGLDRLGYADDLAGFCRFLPDPLVPLDCGVGNRRVDLAWTADNDGDLELGPAEAVPGVFAMRFLGLPSCNSVSFNWWATDFSDPLLDYGPQVRASFRDFGTGGTGSPPSDRDKYHLLRNGECDFDQVLTSTVSLADTTWLPPNQTVAVDVANGFDTRFVLSAGPFDLDPGECAERTLAVVMAEGLHRSPDNAMNLPPHDPAAYLAALDFDDLAANATMAERVFDVPGYDTDGDGYSGEALICGADTVWVAGDGVPDFAGAQPPPPPLVRASPIPNGICVRWNDFPCRIFLEPATREADFEGCAVYLATESSQGGSRPVLIAQWDVEDYRKFVWDSARSAWRMERHRFLRDELVCQYAPGGCDNTQWDPLQYPRQKPFIIADHPDSVFYFEQIGNNNALFGHETPIRKAYPEAPLPPYTDPADVPSDSASVFLTEDGCFKYYEFQLEIESLITETSYKVAVRSFDHGGYASNARMLESPTVAITVAVLGSNTGAEYLVGNVDCSPDCLVTADDAWALVEYLLCGGQPPASAWNADCDQSGSPSPEIQDVTLSDLTVLLDHLFLTLRPLPTE